MIFPPHKLKLMPLILLKSFISIVFILSAFIAMFTMFEVFGRKEIRYNVATLKKIHKINGVIFFLICLAISYLCLYFIFNTKAELSPRGAFHSVLALSLILLLIIKISFIKFYTEFYKYVKGLGITIIVVALLTFGTSGGYYLLVSEFGTFKGVKTSSTIQFDRQSESSYKIPIDNESINAGRALFNEKCFFCHDAKSKDKIVGPGLESILKEKYLPVSKKPSTPESIIEQIRNPIKDMPSFSYLSDDEIRNIIAHLNTL